MLRYGFFDSEIIGYDDENMPIFDRAESSDFLAMFISRIISDGVLALPGDCFQVLADEGMNLKVRPGFGIVKGRFAMDTSDFDITVSKAPSAYKRIDRVVLRANYLQRLCEIVIKEGEPGEKPVPPELIRPAAGDYFELCLANIQIVADQKVITQSNITDTRYDSSVCGVVTQLINHLDTSVFFKQLNAFYQEFVDKSNTCYDQFVDMAQKVYDRLSTMMEGAYTELSQKGEALYDQYSSEIADYILQLKNKGNTDLATLTQQLIDFRNENESEFLAWVESMKNILGEGTAGELLIKIDALTNQMEEMEQMLLAGSIMARLLTDDGKCLVDDMGNVLLMDRPICGCK